MRALAKAVSDRCRQWVPEMPSHDAHYLNLLKESLFGCQSVLDVGCGESSPLCELALPIDLVGVDAHGPTIERATSRGCHQRYELADVRTILDRFGPDSFDAVVALDVIEHLEKEDGWALVEAMEVVARYRVVIFTPNGFLEQEAFDGNSAQVHRSGWSAIEFSRRGYTVKGARGWRPLRGQYCVPRLRPVRLGRMVSVMTQPFVTSRPEFAFQLLAVKSL